MPLHLRWNVWKSLPKWISYGDVPKAFRHITLTHKHTHTHAFTPTRANASQTTWHKRQHSTQWRYASHILRNNAIFFGRTSKNKAQFFIEPICVAYVAYGAYSCTHMHTNTSSALKKNESKKLPVYHLRKARKGAGWWTTLKRQTISFLILLFNGSHGFIHNSVAKWCIKSIASWC